MALSTIKTMWAEITKLIHTYKNLPLQDVISIIWHSTKIEDCSLTATEAKAFLENGSTATGKPLQDHLMVKDHFAAFQYTKEQATKKRKLSISLIQEIGALVMKNTGSFTNTIVGSFDTSKGDLRLTQVYVDQKYFPDYKKVPKLLEQFCLSVNDKIDKVKDIEILKLAADVHYDFVNIHPFGDGNGRTSRLLMNYVQLYHNEPPLKIFAEDKTEYIKALNEAEETKDIAIFRKFIAKQTAKFLNEEITQYNSSTK